MLRLSDEHRRAIEAHGEEGYPEEVCGFLIGVAGKGDEKTVTQIKRIENAWAEEGESETPEFAQTISDFATGTRRRRFKIPPDEYYRADCEARAAGQDILGFYHSHPDHPARPSQYDLNLASGTIPGYSYVIVAVHSGKAIAMTSWLLRDDFTDFDAEEIKPPSPVPFPLSDGGRGE